MIELVFDKNIQLKNPALLLAFRGWSDASKVATTLIAHLEKDLNTEPLAHISPDRFFDFQRARPEVSIVNGVITDVEWPRNQYTFTWSEEANLILGIGPEPHLEWQQFSKAVCALADTCNVGQVMMAGGILAGVPHTRPIPLAGTSPDPEIRAKLHLERNSYHGPTGILPILADLLTQAGHPATTLWASIPHYTQITPNPQAALTLLEALSSLLGKKLPDARLKKEAIKFEQQLENTVKNNSEISAYVSLLEKQFDMSRKNNHPSRQAALDKDSDETSDDANRLPDGEEIAAQIEEFLRSRNDDENE